MVRISYKEIENWLDMLDIGWYYNTEAGEHVIPINKLPAILQKFAEDGYVVEKVEVK